MEFPLETRKLRCSRSFGSAVEQVDELSLGFEPASLNIVFGKPGCGKNLFSRLLALIETPDAGEVCVRGEPTARWTEQQRNDVRSHHFGFVFEAPFLLPSFNVIENIAMPLFKLTGIPPEDAREHTERALEFVEMLDEAESVTDQLPLPVQLRVSLARALVTKPLAVFVENLDRVLNDDDLIAFLHLLNKARRELGCCVVVTASSFDLTSFGTRALQMENGSVTRDWVPGGRFL